ncbi:MAG: transglutaminase domain-containing protein [Gemmataceae bacterium]
MRPRRLAVEQLEDRTLLAGGLSPEIVVGRTLSAYTTAAVQNNRLDVTYTVYNQTADDITGVLLTTSLQPGVTFTTATALPDRSGQDLAWSLGTIRGFDRASVTLTVTLPASTTLQIDSGARAFAMQNAGMVTDDTPPALLSNRVIPADQLASTPDANWSDPFIQEQAAKLDYDPQRIFDYLNNEVGYESYVGSLRGARGTLWSVAGNSLDEASLGVALFRASGIPARYARGTLSDPLAKQLILSMFPASFQTVGYVPAGTEVADPANDPQLLGETRDHYWMQVDFGTGFVNADTSGLGGTTFGTVYTVASSTFTEVADALREKTRITLTAEVYNQGAAFLGIDDGLSKTVVLDRTFSDVELVGRPLSFGHFVSSSGEGSIFTATTITYVPYMQLGDDANPDPRQDLIVIGQSYQDVFSNFAFVSQVATGLFLDLTMTGPIGTARTYSKTLGDRIGYDVRQGGSGVSLSASPTSPPFVNENDIWSMSVLSGRQALSTAVSSELRLEPIYSQLQTASVDSPITFSQTQVFVGKTRAFLNGLLAISGALTEQLESGSHAKAYFDRPRLTMISSHLTSVDAASALQSFKADLLKNTIRVIAAPWQAESALPPFQSARGFLENAIESTVFPSTSSTGDVRFQAPVSTATLFEAARNQAIPVVTLSPTDISILDSLAISAVAKARITVALQAGLIVAVPARSVTLDGAAAVAWYEIDPTTGVVIDVSEDGSHNATISATVAEVVTILGVFGLLFAGYSLFPQIGGNFATIEYRQSEKVAEALMSLNPGSLGDKAAAKNFLAYLVKLAKDRVQDNWLANLTGYSTGYVNQMNALLGAFDVTHPDPPLPSSLVAVTGPLERTNRGLEGVIVPADVSGGTASGTVQTATLVASGRITSSWSSNGVGTFLTSLLQAPNSTVVNTATSGIESGSVTLTATTVVPVSITGASSYAVTGTGTQAYYCPAEPSLGVSGNWDHYTANVTGNVTITLTTDKLTLNGQPLPLGTYTITTSSAMLTGSGATSSPNFAGSVSITSTDGTVTLGPGNGSVTLGGSALDIANGATLDGYTGSITVAAGGGGNNPDSVTLNGTTTHVLTVSATPNAVNADQNTSASFQANVHTSLAGNYTLSAEAPPGWTATISDSGVVTVRPAPGTQSGIYSVRVVARSNANADLVAQAIVPVTVAATSPGMNFTVDPDVIFTVPYAGAAVPTAYRANIQNLGPATDSYTLVFSNLPSGFALINSGTSVTVPAGETGVLGVYLQPSGTLPAPGTPLSFNVTATSTTNPAITQTRTVSFTMPEVHGVILTATPSGFGALPGGSVTSDLVVTAVGNVSEAVRLSGVLSAGLTVPELPTTLTLAPGESQTLPLSLLVADTAALNSMLAARITARFNPLGDVYDQTVTIPIRVTVPGADLLATAAFSAGRSSDPALSNRLSDLASAITTLFEDPSGAVAKSQAVAALDAVIRISSNDVFLSPFVPDLTTYRNRLSAAGPAQLRAVIGDLPNVIGPFAEVVAAAAEHGFTLDLSRHSAVAIPGQSTTFDVLLRNTGYLPTTYDLQVTVPSATVAGAFDRTSITLQPGEGIPLNANRISLSLTETQGELSATNFVVRVTARDNPAITRTTPGSLTIRPAFVQVAAVGVTPGFADPGTPVRISANIFNTANQVRSIRVGYEVRDAAGVVVFTSATVNVSLGIQASLTSVDLGFLDTTGLARGAYTVRVLATDPDGTAIAGGTGAGTLLVGAPVSGSIRVSPSEVPPGESLITTTLDVEAKTTFPDPLTLLGVAATSAPATAVSLFGNYAFVIGTVEISVFDVADPARPMLVRTFGAGDIAAGGYNVCQIDGSNLVVASTNTVNTSTFDLLVYDISDPANPSLSGRTSVPTRFPTDLLLQSGRALITTAGYSFLFGVAFQDQFGDIQAVNYGDPQNPAFTGPLFGNRREPDGSLNPDSGDHPVYGITAVTPQLAYAASTTAKGWDANVGTGRLLIVDTSSGSAVLAGSLEIPGTLQLIDVAVRGNRALVVGSTGGVGGGVADLVLTGTMTLTLLDTTDSLHPAIIGTTLLTLNEFVSVADGIGKLDALDLGNGLFAVSCTTLGGEHVLTVVDPSDPDNILAGSIRVPSHTNGLAVSGDVLFATSQDGLSTYRIGEVVGTPVRIEVPIPKSVTVIPESFSRVPNEIITGSDSDTYVWNFPLAAGVTDLRITWQSRLSGVLPGESRAVTGAGAITFTSEGTSGRQPLAPQQVTTASTLFLSPASRTVQAGQSASFTLTLRNPFDFEVEYLPVVFGLPDEWLSLPGPVMVPANGTVSIPLVITPGALVASGDYGFAVGDGFYPGTVQASLTVTPAPNNPDAESRGATAQLAPSSASAGPGGRAVYRLRLTNTGSQTESFQLSILGLPAGITAVFDQSSISVPPGAGNDREVRFTLSIASGASPGTVAFTVLADGLATDVSVGGELVVLASGVTIRLDRTSAQPGDTLWATVANTGAVAETFDLGVADSGGLVASLGQTSVALSAGESRQIPIATASADFAVRGALPLTVSAVSRTNSAVRDAASATLQVPAAFGLAARLDPAQKTLAVGASAELLLYVENSGNTEDSYSAAISGTTGSADAMLVGLDGIPTATVPVFRLPGLSTGVIRVRLSARSVGLGTVNIRVQSLSETSRFATVTATITVGSPNPPTATPQSAITDAGVPVVLTLSGTDSNNPALPLTFSIVSGPQHGRLGTPVGGVVTFTPDSGYVGADSFTFTATNGLATSSPATVSIDVRPPRPVLLGYHEFGVGAGSGYPAVARFFNPDGSERFSKTVFPGLSGGVRVTSADFNGDGIADLVAGTGPGSITRVVVFDGASGNQLFSIQPFEDRFIGGVFVAAGDITGDGIPELVITPDESGGPRVRVFNGSDFRQLADFYGIDDPEFRGGARAGVGDVNGDGFGDLVVSAGFGGGPRISVTDGRSITASRPLPLFADFFMFESTLRNGAYVTAGDLDGDGFAEVIGGGGPGGGPRVFALSGKDLVTGTADAARVVANFYGGNDSNRGGIRLVARDLDGDRLADLVVGDGTGAGSHVTGYLGKSFSDAGTPPSAFSLDAYPGFVGGVYVG